jgi:hypothetical protein
MPDNASWATILKAATDNIDAIGQQCSGQRIPLIALQFSTIKGEIDNLFLIYAGLSG